MRSLGKPCKAPPSRGLADSLTNTIMAFFLRPRGVTTGCCDCSQVVGCECGGVPCQTFCRSKADNAELCGYEEFGTPSNPPKKYRKKSWAGTMYSAEWGAAGCPDSDGVPVSYTGSFSGGPDFWGDASGSMSAEPVEIDLANNRVKYRITDKSFTPNSTATGWGNMTGIHLVAGPDDGGVAEGGVSIGDEFWVSRAVAKNPWTFFIQGVWSLAGAIGHVDTYAEIDVSKVIDVSYRDEWAIANEFANTPGCAPVETDASKRYAKEFSEFRLMSGGNEEDWIGFAQDLDEAYGALVQQTVNSGVQRTTTGKDDCQGSAAPYLRAKGTVTETLSIEDTEEDAIQRSAVGLEWNELGSCAVHTTYITPRGTILGPYGFGFRIAQVRALLTNLTSGNVYTVTFRIWRRPFDSTSPFAFYAEHTVSFSATAASMYTEWQDVPVERGYETRVMSCKCVSNS